MNEIAAVQPLVVGAILTWAGLGKLLGRLSAARAERSALPRLVGDSHALAAYRTTGTIEVVLGVALLLPSLWWWEPVAASTLALGFLGYLFYARRAAPDSSCGCLGSAAVPVSRRSLVRAGLLLVAALAGFVAGAGWTDAAVERPVTAATVATVELAVFVALSAELDRWWLLPLRRLRVRLTHPLAGAPSTTPLASTVQQLLRSPAFRTVAGSVRSDVHDHWDEGEWRFVTYAVSHGDGPATAVFAVPLLRYEPDDVRVAIVDDDTGETLYRPTGAPVPAT